jgi:hypothetical protein
MKQQKNNKKMLLKRICDERKYWLSFENTGA